MAFTTGLEQSPGDQSTSSDPSLAAATGEEVRFGPSLDDSVLLGRVGEYPSNDVQTRSIPLDPSDVFQCDFASNPNHTVYTVNTWRQENFDGSVVWWAGGPVDMRCGSDTTSGYKHIRQRHQFSSTNATYGWEDVRSSASAALGYTAPQPWDEFMIHAVEDTVETPSPMQPQVNSAQQKICFSAPFYIWKGNTIFAAYYANTVISMNNLIVITAFLSNNSQASACYNGW